MGVNSYILTEPQNTGVFSGLGKASLKLDFDTKDELNEYCARMLAASNPDDNGDEPEGGDRYLLHTVRGLGEFTKEEFINILTENPAEFYFLQDPDKVFQKHIFVDYPNTIKKAYIVNTPIEEVKIWADFNHIKGDNSTKQDRTKIIGLIKPTLENPDLIFTTEEENNYIKSFKSEDGKNLILILIPTTKTNGFFKTEIEKNFNGLFNKIKKGGENIIYRRSPVLTSNKINGLYSPFEFVELHLPICVTQNSPKGLNAPGDVYLLTDTRTKPRKDLEETAQFKKFDIKPFNGEEIKKMQSDDPLLYEQIKSDLSEDLGKTANPYLYNNTEILQCRGLKPTYRILKDYDCFFDNAENTDRLSGYGLQDTFKLISDTVQKHWRECSRIARWLKADTPLQSAFNLWHWLHYNIRYEYDKAGREEVRTPLRVWADRRTGVDCDCLSVFAYCVLKCMGYDPAFEVVAFRNKDNFSHIYVKLGDIIIDRVWYIFNSRPPMVTKSKEFKVNVLSSLGQLF